MIRKGFDNDIYIQKQTQYIRERIAQFGGKLYLEFGGKLFRRLSRIAGCCPALRLTSSCKCCAPCSDQAEIVVCYQCRGHCQETSLRGDLGITV